MADKKISALTASTTPLAGTEVLPIVQGGATVKVSVANLTAGRAVAALSTSTTDGYQFRATDNTSYELLRVVDGSVNPGAFIKARAATADVTLFASGSSVAGQRLMIGAESVEDVVRVSKDNVTVSYGNLVIGTAGKGIDFSANTHAAGMTSELLNDYEEGTWTPTDASGAGLTLAVTNATYTKIGRLVSFQALVTYPATANAAAAVISTPFPTMAANFTVPILNNAGFYLNGNIPGGGSLMYIQDINNGNGYSNAQLSTKYLLITGQLFTA